MFLRNTGKLTPWLHGVFIVTTVRTSSIRISLSGGVESNWVHSARRPLIGPLYLPLVIMKMENFVEGGNRSCRRKPVPVQLCPPQMPLDQTRDRTRVAAVRSRLELWRGPILGLSIYSYYFIGSLYILRNMLWYLDRNCLTQKVNVATSFLLQAWRANVGPIACLLTLHNDTSGYARALKFVSQNEAFTDQIFLLKFMSWIQVTTLHFLHWRLKCLGRILRRNTEIQMKVEE
jgi:hypothetical protein